MKSFERQSAPNPLEHALNNPLLTDTPNLSEVDRFNVSAFGSKVNPRKVDSHISKATNRAEQLVSAMWDRLEGPPAPGIHLEVGAGVEGPSPDMFIREFAGPAYSKTAPYIAVDGGAEHVTSGSLYMDETMQEAIQSRYAEFNQEMAEQGRSEAIQYRVGSGNNLQEAGIEAGGVAELYAANLLLACSLSNQEMYTMLQQFHAVMQPGAHLMIREHFKKPSTVLKGTRATDLHPTNSRGSVTGLAAALDAVGFTERGIDPSTSGMIVAFKAEVAPSKRKFSRPGWLGKINKQH